uniref:Uncharacterized protein n=1 Tax=Anopheles albimanus TaxID=7167 RepID=A0A182FX48_ANOAL
MPRYVIAISKTFSVKLEITVFPSTPGRIFCTVLHVLFIRMIHDVLEKVQYSDEPAVATVPFALEGSRLLGNHVPVVRIAVTHRNINQPVHASRVRLQLPVVTMEMEM